MIHLTCHIVLAVRSTSCSLIVFGFSKNKKGFPGSEGRHDFDRRMPTNVSSKARALLCPRGILCVGRLDAVLGCDKRKMI